MYFGNYIFLLRMNRKIISTLTENETWSLEGAVYKNSCSACVLLEVQWLQKEGVKFRSWLFLVISNTQKASTCQSPMWTGSVTLFRLSSSNSRVGWLRLGVSAQIQITLCKYYVMASESFRITSYRHKQRRFRPVEGNTNLDNFFPMWRKRRNW